MENYMEFINKRLANPLLGTIVSYELNTKYLGMTLDAKLSYRQHHSIIGRNSKAILANYNPKPILLSGVQLWRSTSDVDVKTIQAFKNELLQNIFSCGKSATLIFIEM